MIDEAAIAAMGCGRLAARRAGSALVCGGRGRRAGRGGLVIVSKIGGLPARRSIAARGSRCAPPPKGRVRRAGGGRRSVCENDPGLSPRSSVWSTGDTGRSHATLDLGVKSVEKLAATLTEMGHPISANTVGAELVKLGFSRQSNRKADEGWKTPRPRRPVRIHQHESRRGAGPRPTRHFRR